MDEALKRQADEWFNRGNMIYMPPGSCMKTKDIQTR
jgi:hypothetical protein